MTELKDLPSGVYQHWKGPLYLVLGYGHDANEEGRDVVVYVGLQLDQAHAGPRLAVRTAADFTAVVCSFHRAIEDGNGWAVIGHEWCGEEVCDKHPAWEKVPRFAYVGPSFTPATTKT